jgi:hypothetical protein
VPDLLVGLMARDKPSEMQMGAARCITYMHRAGAISAEDPKILYRTLPCLVRGSGSLDCIMNLGQTYNVSPSQILACKQPCPRPHVYLLQTQICHDVIMAL